MVISMDEAARKRLFDNVFICMKCGSKIRANPQKVLSGKVRCRKCGSRKLRPKSKESRG
ncbi:MAG: 50S ribosomal protein L40e [Candidatus Aenigmarchaeota archaeon]|nr:50S ribosomal protein L40e [Candidatus Aenigmarchaeota archaeon]